MAMIFPCNYSLHHHFGVKWNTQKKNHGKEGYFKGSMSNFSTLLNFHNTMAWLVSLGSQGNHHGCKMNWKNPSMILKEAEEVMGALKSKLECIIGITMDRIKVINHGSKAGKIDL